MISTIILSLKILNIFIYEYFNYYIFGNKTRLYKNLIKKISILNIIFIKIIQWIVIEHDDNELNELVKNMTNNVDYSEKDIDYKLINDIENYNNDNLLINRLPINSGTIALVFSGKLNNNDIVIKIMRNDTKKKLREVIDFLNDILYIIDIISFLNIENYSIKEILKYNMDNFFKQSDFLLEAQNIQLFYNNYINEENIIIPKVYMEYTEEFNNVIIMDYIKGEYLNNINNNYYEYVLLIFHFLNTSLYNYNVLHCDIHPGNIMFIDNKIGIIDFGFISNIDKNTGTDVYTFYNYFTVGKKKKLYKLIIDKLCKKINNDIIIEQEIIDNEYSNFLNFFNEGGLFSYNKAIKHSDLIQLNIFLKRINLMIIDDCINIILSIGPTLSLINFLLNNDSKKKNDKPYYLGDAFKLLKESNIPKELLDY